MTIQLTMESEPITRPRVWQDDAACATFYAETRYDAFYGPNEDDPDYKPTQTRIPKEYREVARRVCEPCPVRLECLKFAFRNNEEYGIWGGLDNYERTQLKTKVRAARAAKAAQEREEVAS